MLEDQEMWTEQTGEDRARLKDFYNVEFRPLIEPDPATARTLVATKVLELIPIPKLHTCLLNPCNHLVGALLETWPPLADWLAGIHVTIDDYHGGKFEGESIPDTWYLKYLKFF